MDTDALRHNLRQVRQAAPRSRVLAVVKAEGYGHGLLPVAQALKDADALAVAGLDEARRLRSAGNDQPLVLLEGVSDLETLHWCAAHQVQPVVHVHEHLDLLEQLPREQALPVWLKVDTGMHRLGFDVTEVRNAWRRLSRTAGVSMIRFMSHLANADERRDSRTRVQLREFDHALAGLEGERSIANSAGVLAWPETHLDWVRPGIMLYGASPFAGRHGAQEELRPAMTFASRLIAVKALRRGDAVGYGGTYVCAEDMNVGVAAVGYGDGFPRHLSAPAQVRVHDQPAAVIGRVSMDLICLDLRGHDRPRIGDPVQLWGPELPVEHLASAADSIAYELFCRVSRRVEFLYR